MRNGIGGILHTVPKINMTLNDVNVYFRHMYMLTIKQLLVKQVAAQLSHGDVSEGVLCQGVSHTLYMCTESFGMQILERSCGVNGRECGNGTDMHVNCGSNQRLYYHPPLTAKDLSVRYIIY